MKSLYVSSIQIKFAASHSHLQPQCDALLIVRKLLGILQETTLITSLKDR